MSDIARALSALCHLDPGMPIDQWHAAGRAAIAAGLSIDDIDAWSSAASNYRGRRDVKMQFSKVTPDGGTTEATLFKMAFDAGWQDPAKGQKGQGTRKTALPTPKATPPEKIAPRPNLAAADFWARCEPATGEHPYIIAKHGRPEGLRKVGAGDTAKVAGQSVAGWLVVPVRSLDGELRTLQLIPPPGIGKKLNLPGASFGDGLFVVGDVATSTRCYIVEGIGQAWAVHRATGCAAVVAFGAGRMATVAQVLRERFASLPLVMVSDRGMENQAAAIARAINGAWIELPADKPKNYDVNDYAAEHGDAALSDLLHQTKTLPMRYRLMRAADVVDAPPLQWLVRGVLPSSGLAALFGASGSGKSFVALDLCAAVAAGGSEWFACRVKSAPVVYVALEGEAGFSQRVQAWQLHHGRDLPGSLRFVMQALDLRNADDVNEIAEAVTAAGAASGLLVIDTLNRAAAGADENSVVDMGAIIAAAKELQAKLGGLVLLVHHSGKDASKGLRGHSSLHAALDAAIEVTRGDGRWDWRIAKSKDGDDSKAHPFKLEVVEIGEHDDGEPITSCVVVADETPTELRRPRIPQSGNQRIAWDALGELLRKAGDGRPKDAPDSLPMGRPSVTVESAVATIENRLADIEPKRRKERAKKALTDLHAKHVIRIDGGLVWIP